MGFDRFLPPVCLLAVLAAPHTLTGQRLRPSAFELPATTAPPPAAAAPEAGSLLAPMASLTPETMPATRALQPLPDDDDTGLAMAGTFAGGIGFLLGATIGSAVGAARCPHGDSGCKLRDALAAGGTGAALLIPLSVHSANHGRGKLLPSFLLSLAENAAGLGLTSLIPADAGMALSGLITAPLSIVTSAAIERKTTPPTPPPQPAPPTGP